MEIDSILEATKYKYAFIFDACMKIHFADTFGAEEADKKYPNTFPIFSEPADCYLMQKLFGMSICIQLGLLNNVVANREIKFRGCALETGNLIYGDLRQIGIKKYIYKQAHCYYEEALIEVEPDSVVQFIATDINNRDVYENDNVKCLDPEYFYHVICAGTWTSFRRDNEFAANMNYMSGIEKGVIVLSDGVQEQHGQFAN